MNKFINEMETLEIISYLKRERYIHGLFYVDRESINSRFGINISDEEWLGFVNFFTEGFNRRNEFIYEGEGEVIEDWKENKYQYGSMLIDEAELFN